MTRLDSRLLLAALVATTITACMAKTPDGGEPTDAGDPGIADASDANDPDQRVHEDDVDARDR